MSTIESSSFFSSSLTKDNQFQDYNGFKIWLKEHCRPDEFRVQQVPLDEMERWALDSRGVRISHESGKFFHIEGIHVKTNFGKVNEWDQPIINQPEIGFLGFITRVFNGTRYFLIQAKMEPGNINTLQISPSLQATKSNFSQVHKGRRPTFLEFFNGEKRVNVLVDYLQTEQGGRFFRKRNRNIVIEIDEDIDLPDEFCWLTLGELKSLLQENNILNMDTRSVLSTIPLVDETILDNLRAVDFINHNSSLSEKGMRFLKSYISRCSVNSTDSLLSWYTSQMMKWELDVSQRPLTMLDGWNVNKWEVEGGERFFSVIGVSVTAGTREQTHWMQPLVKDSHIGLLAFICQEKEGVLHFLVQAKVEPGNFDLIDLAPTVSCSNYAFVSNIQHRPFLFDQVFNHRNHVLFDSLQSEEGGRFYQVQNRNMIVEIPESENIDLPFNYAWMTLAQIKEFMRYGKFNIEARSIISGINFID